MNWENSQDLFVKSKRRWTEWSKESEKASATSNKQREIFRWARVGNLSRWEFEGVSDKPWLFIMSKVLAFSLHKIPIRCHVLLVGCTTGWRCYLHFQNFKSESSWGHKKGGIRRELFLEWRALWSQRICKCLFLLPFLIFSPLPFIL